MVLPDHFNEVTQGFPGDQPTFGFCTYAGNNVCDEERRLGVIPRIYNPSRVTRAVKFSLAVQLKQAGLYIGWQQYMKLLEADDHFSYNGKDVITFCVGERNGKLLQENHSRR